MKWPVTNIGKLCLPTEMRDPTESPDTPFRYIDISSIDKDAKRITSAAEVFGADAPSRARKEVRAGDVLVSTVRPNLNAVALVPKELDGQIASTGFCVLRTNPNLADGRFIFYRCLTPEFVGSLVSQMRGANYPAVSDGVVKRVETPAPAPKEQRRIVELLEQAEGLRQQRAEADKLADRILPTLFLKMFGDPATNPKRFPTGRLRDLATKYSDGPFGSNLKSEHYVKMGVRVVRLQNIGVGKFLDDDKAFVAEDHFAELSKHECRPSDVLIGTLGDPNLRACIQPASLPVALNKADCVQFRPHSDRCTSDYVCWLLNSRSTLAMAGGLIAGQTRPRISMGRLGDLVVPEPPLRLQLQFSALVRTYQPALEKMAAAGPEIQRLFSTMLHRAFTGDLTAKWREAHMKELLEEMEQQARVLRTKSAEN